MHKPSNAILSLVCAIALVWLAPGPARAVEYRLADDPQFRLADDPQYRMASNLQDRVVVDSRYPMARRVNPPAAGSSRRQAAPGKQTVPPAVAARASRYRAAVRATAQAEGVEPELIHAVITAESGYDPSARSHKGAVGLMQLMPGTAAQYGVTNARDPTQNLNAGARHLRYLLDKFDNDMALALAAYNAGEQAVSLHGNRIPPYPETRAYVQRVLAYYHQHLLSTLLPRSL